MYFALDRRRKEGRRSSVLPLFGVLFELATPKVQLFNTVHMLLVSTRAEIMRLSLRPSP